jgi:uncharacterized protein (TIGR00255 family)
MPAPLRSMTGFARVRHPLGDGELVVSAKSVNHRSLDLVIQVPPALEPFEGAIRAKVKSSVVRGHVEVRVSVPKKAAGDAVLALDREFLHDYLRIFREEAAAHKLNRSRISTRRCAFLVCSHQPTMRALQREVRVR